MLLLETSHQGRACVPYDVFTFVCMSGLGQRHAVLRTGDLLLLLRKGQSMRPRALSTIIMITSLNHTKGDTGGISGTSIVVVGCGLVKVDDLARSPA